MVELLPMITIMGKIYFPEAYLFIYIENFITIIINILTQYTTNEILININNIRSS